MSQPGMCLYNLITTLHRGKADAIYQLILTHQLYVDLTQPAILRDPTARTLLREVCREVELHPRDTSG
jgi:hypothetical protein